MFRFFNILESLHEELYPYAQHPGNNEDNDKNLKTLFYNNVTLF
jgi:hypothetical protein